MQALKLRIDLLAISDSLLIFSLFFLGVTQPLLSLLSKQAEFFIARLAEPVDIYSLVATLVAFPIMLALLLAGVRKVSRPAGIALQFLVTVLLFGLTTLGATHSLLATGAAIPLAFGLGVGTALLVARNADFRALVAYTSPLIVVYMLGTCISFLFFSPVHRILTRDINRAALYSGIQSTTPVVFLLFDELPIATLLDDSGKIDGTRFPNFARLAAGSTWFRRTSTVADYTEFAVPALVSGSRPALGKLPICADYPHNLFMLLGGTYRLMCLEADTSLVPPGQQSNLLETYPERMRAMALDLWTVYLYLVVPKALEPMLPDVRHQWREFGVAKDRRHFTSRLETFRRFESAVTSDADRVLYFHHATLPHYPYEYMPSGQIYDTAGEVVAEGLVPQVGNERDAWLNDWVAAQAYQRHLLQTEMCDRLLGELLDRLEQTGVYDRALVIVTADHGACFRGGLSHRGIDDQNFMDIAAIPLFIKTPMQKTPVIDERRAENIDILPTLAGLLHGSLPWTVDGVSLLGPPPSGDRPIRVMRHTDGMLVEFPWDEKRLQAVVASKQRLFKDGVFSIGPNPELIGRPAASQGTAPGEVTMEWLQLLDQVDPKADFQPNRVRGRITSLPSGQAIPLAVAINGTIQATTYAVGGSTGSATFTALVPTEALRAGQNQVDVYRVEGTGGSATLLSVSQPARQQYTISSTEHGLQLNGSAGPPIPVATGRIQGAVEDVVVTESSVLTRGWARESSGSPAEKILFFWKDRFVMAGSIGLNPDDSEKRFGPALREAGFRYALPLAVLKDPDLHALRVFAVKAGVASELPVNMAGGHSVGPDFQ